MKPSRVRIFPTALLSAALVIAALSVTTGPVSAQEPSPEHIAAARAAIASLKVTDQFDAILPNAAESLKTQMIQAAPNLQPAITETVDETALKMAARRIDLEREAALIYARNFTEEELNAITVFYQSEAGKKLITNGPLATRELLRAAEIWSNGITRDLADEATNTLRARLGSSVAVPEDNGN